MSGRRSACLELSRALPPDAPYGPSTRAAAARRGKRYLRCEPSSAPAPPCLLQAGPTGCWGPQSSRNEALGSTRNAKPKGILTRQTGRRVRSPRNSRTPSTIRISSAHERCSRAAGRNDCLRTGSRAQSTAAPVRPRLYARSTLIDRSHSEEFTSQTSARVKLDVVQHGICLIAPRRSSAIRRPTVCRSASGSSNDGNDKNQGERLMDAGLGRMRAVCKLASSASPQHRLRSPRASAAVAR